MNLLERIKLKRKLEPETFYDQLAEDGLLMDYLSKFLEERFNNDKEFRQEMFAILLKHSNEPIVEIERFYLEKMIETMSYFLEFTEQWRT